MNLKKLKKAAKKLKEYEDTHITLEDILYDIIDAIEDGRVRLGDIRDKIQTWQENSPKSN